MDLLIIIAATVCSTNNRQAKCCYVTKISTFIHNLNTEAFVMTLLCGTGRSFKVCIKMNE